MERLASRSEHLRAQNDVLSLTLAESRAMGERLAVLLGNSAIFLYQCEHSFLIHTIHNTIHNL